MKVHHPVHKIDTVHSSIHEDVGSSKETVGANVDTGKADGGDGTNVGITLNLDSDPQDAEFEKY